MSAPAPSPLDALIRVLVDSYGTRAVLRSVERAAEPGDVPRRRRVVSRRERASRAADELARERARRLVGDE